MTKKFLYAIALLAIVSASAYAGDDTMAKIQQVNKAVQTNVQTGIGGWGVTLMGLLPFGLFLGGAAITFFVQLKASKQSGDNDALKIAAWTFGVAFIAAMFGWGVNALIGAFALGNSACGTEVFMNYWRVAMGLIQPGQEHFSCL